MRRWMSVLLILVVLTTFIGCKDHTSFSYMDPVETTHVSMKEASTTPFGRYPKEITYTLGKMTGPNHSNLPEGDTYENNAYTRYLKKMLNIQNKNVFEESTDYDNIVSMAITAQDLPDIMTVSNVDQLQLLMEMGLIEDLSDVYENCASDTIKKIYKSYGKDILDNVTYDGKLMALPETNIENGPSLIWLRKDWMDKLNLEAPKTINDVEHIIREFKEKDPGHNGKGKTIGLVCDSNLVGDAGYSYEYQLDVIFASFGAYPKQWIYNKQGEIVYGSTQPEVKKALQKIRDLYQSGILDSQFLLRSTDNIIDLIVKGQCGSFFGPWWAPNNPLIKSKEENSKAEWEPYLIATDADGSTSYASQKPCDKYIVVRKGYEHPEIVMKIVSVLFDYARYEDRDAKEIKKYYQWNVDPTARPLSINVDYSDALMRCYNNLKKVLSGANSPGTLETLEYSYYVSCKEYRDKKNEASLEDWAAYISRMKACGVIEEGKIHQVKSVFFGETKTMKQEWWKLKSMEEEMYLRIITGEESLESFDDFVKEWGRGGGTKIVREVRAAVGVD